MNRAETAQGKIWGDLIEVTGARWREIFRSATFPYVSYVLGVCWSSPGVNVAYEPLNTDVSD